MDYAPLITDMITNLKIEGVETKTAVKLLLNHCIVPEISRLYKEKKTNFQPEQRRKIKTERLQKKLKKGHKKETKKKVQILKFYNKDSFKH